MAAAPAPDLITKIKEQVTADSVKRIKAEATCSICLELLRDPVTTACGHSFCKRCIDRLCEGHKDATCPQCRQPLPEGTLKPNEELKKIVELFRPQAEEKPAAGNTCEKHQEPLKLFCNEDQTPICLVCRESKDHRGHTVAPMDEALQEYKEKMAEQLGVIESSCGKLHQFVKQVWEHLPENEQEEEYRSMKRVCEKLTTVLQERAESSRQRFGEPPSQPPASPSPVRDVSKDAERQGHSGRKPGREPAAKTREETGSHVSPVSEEASTPKQGLYLASLDQLIHNISNTTEAAQSKEKIRQLMEGIESGYETLNQLVSTDQTDLSQSEREQEHQRLNRVIDNVATLLKVAVQQTRKRPKEGSSTTPAEGSGGSRTGAIPASSEEEGAAMGGRNEAAGEEQQHPAKMMKHNEN